MEMIDTRSVLGTTQTAIFVGAVIQENGRYQLVQEAKTSCRGKWSFPSGHLEPGESIPDGAIREVREETGLLVELTGRYPLIQCVSEHGILIIVVYSAKIIGKPDQPKPDEILTTQQFTRAEIEAMRDELRFPDLTIDLINRFEQETPLPLDSLIIY